MLKLHLSSKELSVAVVAGTDGSCPLPSFGWCLEISQPSFWIFESLYLLRPQMSGSCRRFFLSSALAGGNLSAWFSFVQNDP